MKYEMIKDGSLFRIKALKDFKNAKAGDFGGLVKNEYNLSQEGDCWIHYNAIAIKDSRVSEDATICDFAEISGSAKAYGQSSVRGRAVVTDESSVFGSAEILDKASVCHRSKVYGHAKIFGHATLHNEVNVFGHGQVRGNAVACNYAKIYDRGSVRDYAKVRDHAKISDQAVIKNHAVISRDAEISNNVEIGDGSQISVSISNNNQFKYISGFTYPITVMHCNVRIGLKLYTFEELHNNFDLEFSVFSTMQGKEFEQIKEIVKLCTKQIRENMEADSINK